MNRLTNIIRLHILGPLFENENELVRLDPSDAKFVDVYHTNGGTLLTGKYGFSLMHFSE